MNHKHDKRVATVCLYDTRRKIKRASILRYAYNKFIHQPSEVREAALLCQLVWVVSVFVHHTVGLQSSGTLLENGGQLHKAVLCSKVEERGEFLVSLI